MTLSARLRKIDKDSKHNVEIVEEVPFSEYIMEALSKKVSAIPVWNEYDYVKQFELVLSFLENKLDTEFVDVRLTEAERKVLAENFLKTNNGFGLLDRFLAKPDVSAVMVNSFGSIYVQECDEFKKTASVLSESQFFEITAKYRSDSPIVRVRQGKLFITIMKPPVSDNMIIIKKIKDINEDLSDLPAIGQITAGIASFFRFLLTQRKNIVISGLSNASICEFVLILQNSLSDNARIAIIEDSGFYRPALDNVSSFSVSSLDELDYEFLLDSVNSLSSDYVIADISDNRKFISYYSQLSTTDKGIITAVKAENVDEASAKFINASMISSKCTEKQAKTRFAGIYDYVIHVENVKGIGFRVDSVMEVTSSKTTALVMNEIVKFVDGVFVLDLPEEFVAREHEYQVSSVPVRPARSFRARLKS